MVDRHRATAEGPGTPGDPGSVVSVVVATYCPGEGLDRVIRSLDAQTLPQTEFETIFVDDGSPDDTVDRVRALAAQRPNVRVDRIENWGWPSRPRNVGIALARGRWVFFMDHDDSLYPDALRRMCEYAAETGADVLSPKESKTSDPWWGISALARGDVPDAARSGGIGQLLPMVPHKLYSVEFLRRHGIVFPEGRRRLWEDIVFNVEAWARAERVAILADTPVYLWHSSRSNSSKTYGPRTAEYWDRLGDLMAFIDTTLAAPEHADARRSALLHQYRSRVLARLSEDLASMTPEERGRAMGRAAALQAAYVDEGWDRTLQPVVRARPAPPAGPGRPVGAAPGGGPRSRVLRPGHERRLGRRAPPDRPAGGVAPPRRAAPGVPGRRRSCAPRPPAGADDGPPARPARRVGLAGLLRPRGRRP